jgi:hypothetical protein
MYPPFTAHQNSTSCSDDTIEFASCHIGCWWSAWNITITLVTADALNGQTYGPPFAHTIYIHNTEQVNSVVNTVSWLNASRWKLNRVLYIYGQHCVRES